MTGAALITALGVPNLEPIDPADIPALAAYCGVAILSNWLMLKTYEQIEAARVQPFAYLQIVFVSAIGILVFDEVLTLHVVVGAGIVIAAGLFALLSERRAA